MRLFVKLSSDLVGFQILRGCQRVPIPFSSANYMWITQEPGMGQLFGKPTSKRTPEQLMKGAQAAKRYRLNRKTRVWVLAHANAKTSSKQKQKRYQRGGDDGWFGSGADSSRCGSLPVARFDTETPVPFGLPEGSHAPNASGSAMLGATGSAFPSYTPTVTYPVASSGAFNL